MEAIMVAGVPTITAGIMVGAIAHTITGLLDFLGAGEIIIALGAGEEDITAITTDITTHIIITEIHTTV